MSSVTDQLSVGHQRCSVYILRHFLAIDSYLMRSLVH